MYVYVEAAKKMKSRYISTTSCNDIYLNLATVCTGKQHSFQCNVSVRRPSSGIHFETQVLEHCIEVAKTVRRLQYDMDYNVNTVFSLRDWVFGV